MGGLKVYCSIPYINDEENRAVEPYDRINPKDNYKDYAPFIINQISIFLNTIF